MNAQMAYLWLSEQVWRRSSGQGLIEYGLILSLISVFAILSLWFFGSSFASMLSNSHTCVASPLLCNATNP
jgi:Flp pilus assembly pilin Flp